MLDSTETTSLHFPRVSVGLPVYNGELYLEESLRALRGQSFQDFELIISDNASTDRTEEICRRHAQSDPRIRYSKAEYNRGPTWNSNRVFGLSSGQYFAWATHDDLWDPQLLERSVGVLDTHLDVVCCYSQLATIDPHGEPREPERRKPLAGVRIRARCTDPAATPADRFRGVLLSDDWGPRLGLARRQSLELAGPLKPAFGFEKVVMARLALVGRFFELHEPLYYRRLHPNEVGAIQKAAARRRAFSPVRPYQALFPRIRLLAGYVAAGTRRRVSSRQRIACLQSVANYIFQVNKWRRVVLGTLFGFGNGESAKQFDRRPSR